MGAARGMAAAGCHGAPGAAPALRGLLQHPCPGRRWRHRLPARQTPVRAACGDGGRHHHCMPAQGCGGQITAAWVAAGLRQLQACRSSSHPPPHCCPPQPPPLPPHLLGRAQDGGHAVVQPGNPTGGVCGQDGDAVHLRAIRVCGAAGPAQSQHGMVVVPYRVSPSACLLVPQRVRRRSRLQRPPPLQFREPTCVGVIQAGQEHDCLVRLANVHVVGLQAAGNSGEVLAMLLHVPRSRSAVVTMAARAPWHLPHCHTVPQAAARCRHPHAASACATAAAHRLLPPVYLLHGCPLLLPLVESLHHDHAAPVRQQPLQGSQVSALALRVGVLWPATPGVAPPPSRTRVPVCTLKMLLLSTVSLRALNILKKSSLSPCLWNAGTRPHLHPGGTHAQI